MIKQIIGWISAIGGILGAMYIGGWRLLLVPVIKILDSLVTKTFNCSILLISISKILFSVPIAYVLLLIGFSIATYCWRWWK